MLVASTAMFFAVAGSAFILRARMARCHGHARAAAVAPVIAPVAAEAAPLPCDGPSFQNNDDGTWTVYFNECRLGAAELVAPFEPLDGPYATPLPDDPPARPARLLFVE
jgi:hypothetical protein